MKNKALIFVETMLLLAVAYAVVDAITVNPASNVTADSSNTAGTIVLRDLSGNFSAGTITASSLAPTGPTAPASKTMTQLRAIVPAAGDVYFCNNCTGAVGATGKIVVATGTSAGNFADAAGGVFN